MHNPPKEKSYKHRKNKKLSCFCGSVLIYTSLTWVTRGTNVCSTDLVRISTGNFSLPEPLVAILAQSLVIEYFSSDHKF